MNNSKEITNNSTLEEKKDVNVTTETSTNQEVKEEKKETTTTTTTAVTVVEKKEEKVELKLTHLDKDFIYDVMSIPTVSNAEYRLVTFIVLWARRNGIKYEFDDYGNVYLTKGELAEGEFYPCVTAHLDSVQQKQKPYAQAGFSLPVKTRISTVSKKHEIYVDGMGIGGDDKAGVLICLSMFSHVDKLKAAFFLQEEIGCKGSEHMNVEWFKNVGYVMGYDSPDLNRAAWACSGVKLFSKAFFQEYMEEVCKEHGLTRFLSEPFTDVKVIREKTNIICMNFGTGYYGPHGSTEYCVLEDMDNACRMGHALINKIGNTEHKLEHKSSHGWVKTASGSYQRPEEDEDEKFLKTLSGYSYTQGTGTSGGYTYGGGSRYSGRDCWDDYEDYYGDYGYGTYGGGKGATSGATTSKATTTPSSTTTSTTTSTAKKTEGGDENTVNVETLHYISDKYEQYVDDIKDSIKAKCEEMGINFFVNFAPIFENKIKF